MIYSGTIKSQAGAALKNAGVQFVNSTGQTLVTLPVTAAGAWQLDSTFDDGLLMPGISAVFTAPGYYPYSISADKLPPVFSVTLTKKVDPALLLGVGAGVALLIFSSGGKKVVGEVEQESKKQGLPGWVLPVVAIGTGVALIWNFFNKPDPKSSDSAKLAQDAADQVNVLKSQGEITMLSDADLEGLCSQIVEATDDCGTDENAIYNVFYQLFNDADFWSLVKKFGVREIKSCFGGNYFGNTPYNLVQIIQSELGTAEKVKVNSILAGHGITYQF